MESETDRKRQRDSEIDDQQIAAKHDDLKIKILNTYQKQEYGDCLRFIEESLKIDPHNTHHKILKASCWTALDINGSETYELLRQVIKEDPENPFAYYGMGLKYYHDAELMESVEYLNQAISLSPTNAMQKAVELKQKATLVMEAICDANVKFEANNIEMALQVLSTAIFMDPKNKKVHTKISDIRQFFIKDLVARLESEVELEIAESEKKIDSTRKIERAEQLINEDNLQDAEKLLEEVSKYAVKSEQFLFVKGYLLYKSGALKEAIPLLKEATIFNPCREESKRLLENAEKLAELLDASAEKTIQKKHLESIELLTEVLEVDEKNVRINQAAYFQRALAYFSLGKSVDAFSDFKKFESLQTFPI